MLDVLCVINKKQNKITIPYQEQDNDVKTEDSTYTFKSKQDFKDLVYIPPVQCFTCGRVINQSKQFNKMVDQDKLSPVEAFILGITHVSVVKQFIYLLHF